MVKEAVWRVKRWTTLWQHLWEETALRKRALDEVEEGFCRGEAITDGVSF